MGKSVSVIIPNYNGKMLLARFLPSVFAALRSQAVSESEVIVSDDASTDDSLAFLQENFPSVVTLPSSENGGFSKTANRGIAAARFDYVLLLNNDMSVAPDFFDKLLPLFAADAAMFGVSPMTLDAEGKHSIEAQKLPKTQRGRIHYSDNLEQQENAYTLYLCGGNALIDRQKLIALGGFETVYSPFYFEDFDLSLQAWERGWHCYYSPSTRCRHVHSATINKLSESHTTQTFLRNKLILNYLHLSDDALRRFSIDYFFKYCLNTLFPSPAKRLANAAYRDFTAIRPELKTLRLARQKRATTTLDRVIQRYF